MTSELCEKVSETKISMLSKGTESPSYYDASSLSNQKVSQSLAPFEQILLENVSSFNLIQNNKNEKCTKKNSENTDGNLDNQIIEIILNATSNYKLIEKKLRELFALFGEITSFCYDSNIHTVQIVYKYYFSSVYALKFLICTLKQDKDNESKARENGEKNENKKENIFKDKEYVQVVDYLTENYKIQFKTNIFKEEEKDDKQIKDNNYPNNEDYKTENEQKKYIITKEQEFSQIKSNTKEMSNNKKLFMKQNLATPIRFVNKDNKNLGSNRNYINPLSAFPLPPMSYFPYIQPMNAGNVIRVPVPVPIPVPVAVNLNPSSSSPQTKTNTKTLSSCAIISNSSNKQGEKVNECQNNNNIPQNINKEKSQNKEAIKNSKVSKFASADSNSQNDLVFFASSSEESKSKSNDSKKNEKTEKGNEKKTEKLIENKSLINGEAISKRDNTVENIVKESNDNSQKLFEAKKLNKTNEEISEIKIENIPNDLLSTFGRKRMSLEKLNFFLQNNKPISNFNNPTKSLSGCSEKYPSILPMTLNEYSKMSKAMLNNYYYMSCNYHMNQFNKPKNFNKNVIDFDKLTLDTKNTIRFMTYSSRDYYFKYVCNFLIQINNDDKFMVTKRIIGKNGCFLKRIIQESCIKYGDFSTKIRLRGKGSGYIEMNNKESDEPLMLCISSLNYPTYVNCCSLIEDLLRKIYNDYNDFLICVLPKEMHHNIEKKKIVKHEYVVDRVRTKDAKNKKD